MRNEMNRIQSKDYNKGAYRINKISLSSYDDGKYILKDGYSRLSNFHKFTCQPYKNNFVKYRKIILIFALVKIAILFRFFSTL